MISFRPLVNPPDAPPSALPKVEVKISPHLLRASGKRTTGEEGFGLLEPSPYGKEILSQDLNVRVVDPPRLGKIFARSEHQRLQLSADALDADEGFGGQEGRYLEHSIQQILGDFLIPDLTQAVIDRVEGGLAKEIIERRVLSSFAQPIEQRWTDGPLPQNVSYDRVADTRTVVILERETFPPLRLRVHGSMSEFWSYVWTLVIHQHKNLAHNIAAARPGVNAGDHRQYRPAR